MRIWEFEIKNIKQNKNKINEETNTNIRNTFLKKYWIILNNIWKIFEKCIKQVKRPGSSTTVSAAINIILYLHHEYQSRIYVEPKVLEEKEFQETEALQSIPLHTWHSEAELSRLHEVIDLAVCLGGDGTILWTSGLFNYAGMMIRMIIW